MPNTRGSPWSLTPLRGDCDVCFSENFSHMVCLCSVEFTSCVCLVLPHMHWSSTVVSSCLWQLWLHSSGLVCGLRVEQHGQTPAGLPVQRGSCFSRRRRHSRLYASMHGFYICEIAKGFRGGSSQQLPGGFLQKPVYKRSTFTVKTAC